MIFWVKSVILLNMGIYQADNVSDNQIDNKAIDRIEQPYNEEDEIIISNVSLLLHMDGTSGSTVFTDSSTNNLTATRTGGPTISTSVKKFGTGAGFFDSSTDYLTYSSNPLFGFGTGDFTIEMWIYPQGTNAFQGFFNIGTYEDGILMRWHADSEVTDSLYINSIEYNWSPSVNAPRNTWTHVALVRNVGTVKMFANGINRIGNVVNNSDLGSSAIALIGASAHNPGEGFNGYIDEVRVTKGVALYTSDFTPPSEPFANP